MVASYRNLDIIKKLTSNIDEKNLNITPKYIKGYANDNSVDFIAKSLGLDKGLVKQYLNLEEKELDAYDPYHITDAKKEDFWEDDGKKIQQNYDQDTNTFKRGLYSNPELGGYGQTDFWYEDPFIPAFEIFFDTNDSAFFSGYDNLQATPKKNSIKYFIDNFGKNFDSSGYNSRLKIWEEFNNAFFKIFEKDTFNKNLKNKSYYITKLSGLDFLNKKIIKYGEDKITITLNEDVSMLSWYISELYKHLVYSYRNQRYMFPDNLLRFNMTIIINDMRNFQIPKNVNFSSDTNPVNSNSISNKDIKYEISEKSKIIYTLHDCNFSFFESKNYGNEIEIGGYGGGPTYNPQTLSFDIFFKSVTRSSVFPLIDNSLTIDPWETDLTKNGLKLDYINNLSRINTNKKPEKKSFTNQLLSKSKQTILNQGLNYADNLEKKLREVRGDIINKLLSQINNISGINKIEPDNIYDGSFNNLIDPVNAAKKLASGLINDLQDTIRDSSNF